MSGAVTLSIGASKLKKHFSFILAIISAAKPHVLGASWTITHLPVFFTEFIIVSVSKGEIVLKPESQKQALILKDGVLSP